MLDARLLGTLVNVLRLNCDSFLAKNVPPDRSSLGSAMHAILAGGTGNAGDVLADRPVLYVRAHSLTWLSPKRTSVGRTSDRVLPPSSPRSNDSYLLTYVYCRWIRSAGRHHLGTICSPGRSDNRQRRDTCSPFNVRYRLGRARTGVQRTGKRRAGQDGLGEKTGTNLELTSLKIVGSSITYWTHSAVCKSWRKASFDYRYLHTSRPVKT